MTTSNRVYMWGCHPHNLRYAASVLRRSRQMGQLSAPVGDGIEMFHLPALVDTTFLRSQIVQVGCLCHRNVFFLCSQVVQVGCILPALSGPTGGLYSSCASRSYRWVVFFLRSQVVQVGCILPAPPGCTGGLYSSCAPRSYRWVIFFLQSQVIQVGCILPALPGHTGGLYSSCTPRSYRWVVFIKAVCSSMCCFSHGAHGHLLEDKH